MKDLRSSKYQGKNVGKSDKIDEKLKEAGINLDENQKKQAEELKKKLGNYKGKSEDEIMNDIFDMAQKNKAEGKLDNKAIDKFTSMIAPMLNTDQKKKMNVLIDKLKKS